MGCHVLSTIFPIEPRLSNWSAVLETVFQIKNNFSGESRRSRPERRYAIGGKPSAAVGPRLASGMSRTIDRRRPRKLDDAQKAEVDRHPEVRLLRRRQKKLFEFIRDKHGSIASMKGTPVYDRYQKAFQAHRNMKRRQEAALLQKVKARYKKEQPVTDYNDS